MLSGFINGLGSHWDQIWHYNWNLNYLASVVFRYQFIRLASVGRLRKAIVVPFAHYIFLWFWSQQPVNIQYKQYSPLGGNTVNYSPLILSSAAPNNVELWLRNAVSASEHLCSRADAWKSGIESWLLIQFLISMHQALSGLRSHQPKEEFGQFGLSATPQILVGLSSTKGIYTGHCLLSVVRIFCVILRFCHRDWKLYKVGIVHNKALILSMSRTRAQKIRITYNKDLEA